MLPIREMTEGDTIDGLYAVSDANFLTTASGKPYVRMILSDATGQVTANMWDVNRELFTSIPVGGIIKLRGQVETYRGKVQVKITALRPALPDEVDPRDFLPATTADVPGLERELLCLIESLEDPEYKALLSSIFGDAKILDAFRTAPAAKTNHHACVGGLIEHTMSIARLCEMFCKTSTTPLDRDLLLAGALLHDIGKVSELSAGVSIEYSDIGRLIGHLTIGAMMVETHAARLGTISETKKWLVQHMILSHHGRREYGSPVLPAIPEAFALHHIDNLDAKTVAARKIIDDDPSDQPWTARSFMLETALFKNPIVDSVVDSSEEPPGPPASEKGRAQDQLF